jgi:hypothetical protein
LFFLQSCSIFYFEAVSDFFDLDKEGQRTHEQSGQLLDNDYLHKVVLDKFKINETINLTRKMAQWHQRFQPGHLKIKLFLLEFC